MAQAPFPPDGRAAGRLLLKSKTGSAATPLSVSLGGSPPGTDAVTRAAPTQSKAVRSGVCDLHVRFHRPAQGHCHQPPRHLPLFAGGERTAGRQCAEDRVYQGFSVAFDMSFEEIWISYLVGATLWIAPPALVGDPDLLAQTLARERITVLHAVPTLMSLLDRSAAAAAAHQSGRRSLSRRAGATARAARQESFQHLRPHGNFRLGQPRRIETGRAGDHRPAAAELRPAGGGRAAPAAAGGRSRASCAFSGRGWRWGIWGGRI